jgi:glycerol-3-phosphate acyltransferase PlsY
MVASILLILGGYLLGSIPSAYLAGKWVRGIDLRNYGSGTVSGSMVWEHVSKWALPPVAVFDVAKAMLPTWLGLQFGLGEMTAGLAGIAAGIGHNWPIFLRFTGGRGLSPLIGMWLLIYPVAAGWMAGFLMIGWLFGDSAPWAVASLLSLPIVANALNGPATAVPLAVLVLVVALIKRVEANRRPLPVDRSKRLRLLWRRAWFDRDIASHKEWIARTPDKAASAKSPSG